MSNLDPANFTHLRVHSRGSLLRSTAAVNDLVQRAAADGLKALALTDNQALYSAIQFEQACRAAGLQPIIGMTVGLRQQFGKLTDRPQPPATELAEAAPVGTPSQLVLLATGPEGYQSLCRLSAGLQASPDREARLQNGLSWADLKTYHEGLICIEAGLSGRLAHHLQGGQRQAAAQYAGRLAAIFTDRCYVGLELHFDKLSDRGLSLSKPGVALAREMVQIGGRFGMQPVVAQPVRCLEPDEADLLPLLTAIERNCRLEEVQDEIRPGHWLNPSEIEGRFADFPEAIANVESIIQQCQPALPDGRTIWPALD
jgi:DNA polymerase III subunit alpha